jgi:hypothetical protein
VSAGHSASVPVIAPGTEGDGGVIVTVALLSDIAPAVESALPNNKDPDAKLIAPVEIKVPPKLEFTAKLKAPLTCQYTLQKEAPFIRLKFDAVVVPTEKAPPILIIKIGFARDCPSKVIVPSNEVAAPVLYMPGRIV